MHGKIAVVCLLLSSGNLLAQGLFDQAFTDKQLAQAQFPVTAECGPYMVKLASFTGADGMQAANTLAANLREKHKLETYVFRYRAVNELEEREKEQFVKRFEEKFKIKPRMPRMVTPPPDNYVVLAGNFRSIDDPKGRQLLEAIRKINPQTISPEVFRRMLAEGVARPNKAFTAAMLVRNPLLPPERAGLVVDPRTGKARETIDRKTAELLLKLNDQEQYSVYRNGSPYTIKVADFRGASMLNEKKAEQVFGSLKRDRSVDSRKSSLQKAAENAIVLCDLLRKQGYESYVFHGEYASLVTVGGYSGLKDPRLHADMQAITKAMQPVIESNQKLPPSKWQVVLAPTPIVTPRRPTPDVMAN